MVNGSISFRTGLSTQQSKVPGEAGSLNHTMKKLPGYMLLHLTQSAVFPFREADELNAEKPILQKHAAVKTDKKKADKPKAEPVS